MNGEHDVYGCIFDILNSIPIEKLALSPLNEPLIGLVMKSRLREENLIYYKMGTYKL